MPRGPRLDIEGGLYHVIARGVERRPIFRDDTDRQGFVRRLQMVAGEEGLQLFAYVLLDNHVHLVVPRGAIALGQCMRRLITGHSVVFNRRRGIHPVELSRHLGVSRAAVTDQRRTSND
jgi:REP element-mobilizing transposase RayT